MMTKKFYLVWNEQGSCPTYKHPSLEDAEREATRLAKQNPGCKFHVLESVSTLEVPDPVIKTVHLFDLDDNGDMPF